MAKDDTPTLSDLSAALSLLADKLAGHPVTVVGFSSVAIGGRGQSGTVIGTYASANGNSGGQNIGLYASASTGDTGAAAAATANQKGIEEDLRAFAELLMRGSVKKGLIEGLLDRALAVPRFAGHVLPVLALVEKMSALLPT